MAARKHSAVMDVISIAEVDPADPGWVRSPMGSEARMSSRSSAPEANPMPSVETNKHTQAMARETPVPTSRKKNRRWLRSVSIRLPRSFRPQVLRPTGSAANA